MIVHATAYGRAAALLLRERIAAAKQQDPLQPVTVVVPTNYVGVSTRRLLASGTLGPITARGSGVAGLTLLTVYRLAELLGAPRLAAGGRRPVSTPVIGAAVRRVLADAPGIFAPVREHPSTEEALVRAHRELSELQPSSLDVLAAASSRAAEVVRIHRAVRERLAGAWFEEADLMAAAHEVLLDGSPILGDLGTVLVYLPQNLTLPAAALLRALNATTTVEVLAAFTGARDADADVVRTLRRLDAAAAPTAAASEAGPPHATAVVSVSDAEEEVRSAVQRIVDAARDGRPLERMAILYPSPNPYARILDDQLEAAGIPFNGRAVRPLRDRLLGRWLLDLLALPDGRFARPAVLGLVSAAPVTDDKGRWVAAGTWERISREAGIVAGAGEWRVKLARFADEMRHRADAEENADEPREWLVDRLRRNAEQADGLQRFVAELCGHLGRAATLQRWSALAEWCHDMVARYLGGERRRQDWPEVERAAAERVEEALDRLAGLDEVEPATDLATFARALELELDGDLGRVGEFGQGVLVGTTSASLGIDLDIVVVLGLAEGVSPTRPREDSLLSDADRAVVADELPPRTERTGIEHRHLLAALAAAQCDRVLTFPRGDLRRSTERAPSRWLLDSVAVLRGDGKRELPDGAEWFRTVPSFAHRASTGAFPATRQLYGLRALAEPAPRGTPAAQAIAGHPLAGQAFAGQALAGHPLVVGDPVLRLGTELVLARRSDAFTRFDGNLAGLAAHIASPANARDAVSASRLESWLACPHGYFVRHLLRVEPVENPEELVEISPTERGSLVHEVLERWLGEQLGGELPAPGEPWPDKARLRLHELGKEACRDAEQRGITGHPLLWQRDRRRILGDLDRFLDADDERRRGLAATPVAAEHPFGLDGAPPLAIDLGEGRVVLVRGRIDRVDRTPGGLVVTDYKTGSSYKYRDLNEGRPLGDGAKLQLAIYALAVAGGAPGAGDVPDEVRSEYWFVSMKGRFERVGYVVSEAVVDELRRALRITVDGIEGGLFPLKPPAPGWSLYTECRYCDPDELGTADRYREWQRVRRAPELRDYLAYIDPDAAAEEQL